jgi:pyridoxine 5-phosphate synthase
MGTNRRIQLGVNVDHVATIRQQRDTLYPDPITAASIAELAGADQITIHLREDRRHITDRDVSLMRKTVQTRLNLEMAATKEMQGIALEVRPDQVTLVPEKREERTTEGGLDVAGNVDELRTYIAPLRELGIKVVNFVDADVSQIEATLEMGAQGIEIHTGEYCDAKNSVDRDSEYDRIALSASHGRQKGLFVAAGHGLDYTNTEAICFIDAIEELNIGHSIIARAVLVGLDRAVREMREIMDQALS